MPFGHHPQRNDPMRKMQLVAASGLLAVLLISPATAVTLNSRGLGQVLIYPYYTVNKGQDTLVSVLNTSAIGKVVTLRFREGHNGRSVLAFNLYLSAHDEWTGVVSSMDGTDESGARLSTADKSCIDSSSSAPFAFSTAAFDGTDHPADDGLTTPARTREGHFEMIAAGDIVPGSPTDIAITHIPDPSGQPNMGMPPGCDSLPGSVASDIVAPTSGLSGTAAIINVGEGTFYPYVADALADFANTPLIDAGTGLAALEDANASRPDVPGVVADVLDNDGRTMTLGYARGVDAVSAVFMSEAVFNEYLFDPALGANTDWVVTFPTRHAYVDKALYPSLSTEPFSTIYPMEGGVAPYDREGLQEYPVRCPMEPCIWNLAVALTHEVNVIGFGVYEQPFTSPVFGSFLFTPHGSFSNGWMQIAWAEAEHAFLPGGTRPGQSGSTTLLGLPVSGFMAYNIINSQAAPGRLANYGGTFRHRSRFACSSTEGGCP
jgi:hypothetical protein